MCGSFQLEAHRRVLLDWNNHEHLHFISYMFCFEVQKCRLIILVLTILHVWKFLDSCSAMNEVEFITFLRCSHNVIVRINYFENERCPSFSHCILCWGLSRLTNKLFVRKMLRRFAGLEETLRIELSWLVLRTRKWAAIETRRRKTRKHELFPRTRLLSTTISCMMAMVKVSTILPNQKIPFARTTTSCVASREPVRSFFRWQE